MFLSSATTKKRSGAPENVKDLSLRREHEKLPRQVRDDVLEQLPSHVQQPVQPALVEDNSIDDGLEQSNHCCF